MSSRPWASRTTAAAAERPGVFAILHRAQPPGTGHESGQQGQAGGNGTDHGSTGLAGCVGDGGRACRAWQCRQQERLGGAFATVETARAGIAQTAWVLASK